MIQGAVLGSPINHSLSPILHSAAFEFLGISGHYQAIEVKSGELKNFLHQNGESFDYFSLTMPLKEEVFSLDYTIDESAKGALSGNTIFKRDGSFVVANTDSSGFLNALRNAGLGSISKVLVLGAGGTSRAVCAALNEVGVAIDVMGRTQSRSASLQAIVTRSDFRYLTWNDRISVEGYDLVVNTTPAGAADLLSENIERVTSCALFDVIYRPWPTRLGRKWIDLNGVVISGLELLLYQGLDQLSLVLNQSCQMPELISFCRTKLHAAAQ